MTAVLIRGVLPYGEGDPADVLVDDGQIADIGVDLTIPEDADVVDATGQILLPGFVDLHTHLREPGREYAEDIETGSAAAALGGYTAVFAMATYVYFELYVIGRGSAPNRRYDDDPAEPDDELH